MVCNSHLEWLNNSVCLSDKREGVREILKTGYLCLAPGRAGAESQLLHCQEFCELVVRLLVASTWPWLGVFMPEKSARAKEPERHPSPLSWFPRTLLCILNLPPYCLT